MKSPLSLAALVLLSAGAARAGQSEDLEQVIQLASQGQNAQTSAEVRQYVQGHQDQISGILQTYRAYLALSDVGVQGAPPPAASGTNAAIASLAGQNTAAVSAETQTAGGQTTSLQTSTGLKTGGLQTGALATSHLPGVPGLPDVSAASAITDPNAAQLQHAAEVQAALQVRKRVLMKTPLPYND